MAQTPEHAPHIPHIPLPDIRGGAKWTLTHWKPVGLSLAALGGIYLALASDRGPDTPPQEPSRASDTVKPPEQAPIVGIVPNIPKEPTATAKSDSATAEAQKPTPTPTPEAQGGPIECAFIPDCSGAELIEWVDGQGNRYILIGFDPEPGTPLLAYESGQLTKEKHGQTSILRGFGLSVVNPNNPEQYLSLHGDINIGEFRTQNISKGNKIGEIQDTGVTNFGHRLIAVGSEDILRSVIPFVFSQKAKRFEGSPPVTGPVSNSRGQATPIYANVPLPQ